METAHSSLPMTIGEVIRKRRSSLPRFPQRTTWNQRFVGNVPPGKNTAIASGLPPCGNYLCFNIGHRAVGLTYDYAGKKSDIERIGRQKPQLKSICGLLTASLQQGTIALSTRRASRSRRVISPFSPFPSQMRFIARSSAAIFSRS